MSDAILLLSIIAAWVAAWVVGYTATRSVEVATRYAVTAMLVDLVAWLAALTVAVALIWVAATAASL